MKVLVACEESQEVCKAFRARGHEAYSNDIQECSGGYPEWHLQMGALSALEMKKWDLLIAHPPCTYLSKAGARWMYQGGSISQERLIKMQEASAFFYELYSAPIERIAIENPTPLKIAGLLPHDQVIQPYEFGEPYSKRTLLWLKNLPPLRPTNVLTEFKPLMPSNTGGKKKGQKYHYTSISQKDASKTFPGIAKAMAEQWG